jgi:LemA protein
MTLSWMVWILLGIVVLMLLVVGWAVGAYNRLVGLRNRFKNAYAQIDVQLKRRYDLIPNLVETVKGYAKHEREVLEQVTQARATALASQGSPASQAKDENALVSSLRKLLAVAENYPDLKASKNFLELQHELTNTEDRIQRARRFYNGNVRDYNNKVQSVPSNLIANMFHFKNEEFFEIENAIERQAPEVKI